MKILFVNENIGGHATVHHHLANALALRPDIDAEFFDVPPAGLIGKVLRAPIPGLAALDADLQPLRAQLALSASVRMRLRSRLAGADVMHVYTHNAALLSVGHVRHVPTIVTLDSTNALNAYRLPYREPTRWTSLTVAATKPFERRVYGAAQRIVANSEWVASSLRNDYGITDDKLAVFPFGISSPNFDQPAAPGTANATMPRLVFVGRQLRRKGGEMLRELHQAHLADRCELVLVTNEPVAPGRNLTVINDIGPGDERLWDVLRAAAVFVFPSTIDSAPNAVLEAMAAGLPVIAVDTGALGEMVADGHTGLLVPPHDGPAVLAAIERLLGDPAGRAAMGAAGRSRQLEHYDVRTSADRLIGLLTSIARPSSAPRLDGSR
jgi:alpha-maltose-1-phosphate synthase